MAKRSSMSTNPVKLDEPNGPAEPEKPSAADLYEAALKGLTDAFSAARRRDEQANTGSIFTMSYSSPWAATRKALAAAVVAMVDPTRCAPPDPQTVRVKIGGGES